MKLLICQNKYWKSLVFNDNISENRFDHNFRKIEVDILENRKIWTMYILANL